MKLNELDCLSDIDTIIYNIGYSVGEEVVWQTTSSKEELAKWGVDMTKDYGRLTTAIDFENKVLKIFLIIDNLTDREYLLKQIDYETTCIEKCMRERVRHSELKIGYSQKVHDIDLEKIKNTPRTETWSFSTDRDDEHGKRGYLWLDKSPLCWDFIGLGEREDILLNALDMNVEDIEKLGDFDEFKIEVEWTGDNNAIIKSVI